MLLVLAPCPRRHARRLRKVRVCLEVSFNSAEAIGITADALRASSHPLDASAKKATGVYGAPARREGSEMLSEAACKDDDKGILFELIFLKKGIHFGRSTLQPKRRKLDRSS